MYTFGFIGTGNMGSALAAAARKKLDAQELAVSNRTPEKAAALAARLGCAVTDNAGTASASEYIFLGVKPQVMPDMLSGIAPVLCERKDRFILVSMAAGLTVSRIRELAGGDYPVIRIMPNTPCSIGRGVVLCCRSGEVTDGEYQRFFDLLAGAGRLIDLPEGLIDAGSALSGCGPAYVYMFIEALADGGVSCGLPRDKAMELAAETLAGSAELVMESGKHPGALKDAVCSPGGSTIAGVRALESSAFRAAAIDAVIAAFNRTQELGK